MEQSIHLTNEQKIKLQQIEFNYSEAKNSPQSSTENELFSRLVNLDEEIKRKALRISIIEGMIG
ncbi:MAG: hypothetical protein K6F00_05605, partial [Lachnospiraceae bacterium]|nr:hypothetical protein [Lachnospiraceae bacterium]